MAQPKSQFEELARDAAANVQAAREAGEQLTFLPVEGETSRKARGKGKVVSQLREFLAVKGLRMPEDVLIEMAGMASTEDAFLTAMARTEQMLLWAEKGARKVAQHVNKDGKLVETVLDTSPTMSQRQEAFKFMFTIMLRSAEALVPYGLGKVTPDVVQPTIVPVIMPADRASAARDITPQAPRLAGRMVPADVAWQMQQNQQVSDADPAGSDAESRTE
jgi:hypothetical protein